MHILQYLHKSILKQLIIFPLYISNISNMSQLGHKCPIINVPNRKKHNNCLIMLFQYIKCVPTRAKMSNNKRPQYYQRPQYYPIETIFTICCSNSLIF